MRLAIGTGLLALALVGCAADDDMGVGEADRGSPGKADLVGSCGASGACGAKSDGNCWCDYGCHEYGDCCADKLEQCPDEGNACATLDDEDADGLAGCDDPGCVDSPCMNECGEVLEPDESGRFAHNGQEINSIQEQAATEGGHEIRRGFHNKGHLCVPAEFRVLPDLPDEVRVGPVLQPGNAFSSWVRISNGSPFVAHDLAGDFRGLAIKLVGVEGEKILDGHEDASTQDFLMLNNPFMAAPSAETFMEFTRAATDPERKEICAGDVCVSDTMLEYLNEPGHEDTRGFILKRVVLRIIGSLRDQRFWSGSTFKFGDTTMRYSVKPCKGGFNLPGLRNDYLRRDLVDHLESEEVCFDFYVQLATDAIDERTGELATPVENASDEWTERESPPIRVAQLVIPPIDMNSCSAELQEAYCNDLRFTPWHSAPQYRPLGSINRVRLAVYQASQSLRDAEVNEPDGSESFSCP